MPKEKLGLKMPVRYDRVAPDIQTEFVLQGRMKPIRVSRFYDEIEAEIKAHKQMIEPDLRRNWVDYFPGVPYSDELLAIAIDQQLQKYVDQAIAEFNQKLKKHRQFTMISSWIFRKWEARLYLGLAVSTFSLPGFLYLFFTPNDLALSLGFFGLLFNILSLGFIAYKTGCETTRQENKGEKEEKE